MHSSVRAPRAPSIGGRVAIAIVVAGGWGCDAKLETSCVTGDTCADYAPEPGVLSVGDCLASCNLTEAGNATGEYPCEVQRIMDTICKNCHSDPPANDAPFSLATYPDSQVLRGQQVLYSVIVSVVGLEEAPVDRMPKPGPPLDLPPLDSDDRRALLDDWACVCAPPRPEGETCE